MNMCQHAKEILQYVEDVKNHPNPWVLWQFRRKGSDMKWGDMDAHPDGLVSMSTSVNLKCLTYHQ